jgi:Tfp pilus assembly protein PilF
VLSKTVTCTLPAVLVLLLWWKHGRLTRRDLLMLLPLFAIALGFAKLTSGMEQWNVGAVGPEFQFTWAQRILIAGRAVWFYAGKLIWPHPLIFMYPRWTIDPHAIWQWSFPTAAVIVIAALWLLRNRIGRGPLVAVLFFIGTLFPALGFVNVYPMRFSFVADHFQYLASLGILVLIVQLARKMLLPAKSPSTPGQGTQVDVPDTNAPSPRRPGSSVRSVALDSSQTQSSSRPAGISQLAAPIIAGAVLLTFTLLSYRQARIYHDAGTLWTDTLEKNPDCWLAMDNLAADALEHGDRAAAFDWYARSLAIHPNQPEAHLSRGELFASGQPPKFKQAEAEFAAAAKIRPDNARPIHELAKLFAAEGNFPAAAAEYQRALELEPRLEPARLEYANLLRLLNHPQEAEAQYQKAIDINPDSYDARAALAGMDYQSGKVPEAIELMSEATDLNPTDPAMFNNYGVFLMAAGKAAEAAGQFNSAIALDPTFADAYDGLGNALAAQGQSAQAANMFRKAIELKPGFEAARQHLAALEGH